MSSIDLTGLTATPTTVGPGQTSQVVPTITGDSTQTDVITGTDENGDVATVTIVRTPEALVADLNAGDIVNGKAPAGKIVYTHSNSAFFTLAANGTGVSVTASS